MAFSVGPPGTRVSLGLTQIKWATVQKSPQLGLGSTGGGFCAQLAISVGRRQSSVISLNRPHIVDSLDFVGIFIYLRLLLLIEERRPKRHERSPYSRKEGANRCPHLLHRQGLNSRRVGDG